MQSKGCSISSNSFSSTFFYYPCQMWMNVPVGWTTVAVILNVLTLLGVFHADVIMVIPKMA